MTDPVNQLFFFSRGDTILKVLGFQEDEISERGETMEVMTVLDLRNNKRFASFFRDDIGDELMPVPKDFPQEKIDAYLNASRVREEAEEVMLDIQQHILMWHSD